jgi:hypothetical protein
MRIRRSAMDAVLQQHPQLQDWLARDTAPARAGQLAALVAVYREHHGHGPTWVQFAQQARPDLVAYPQSARRAYADRLVRRLASRGWLVYTDGEPGSLTPGPAR